MRQVLHSEDLPIGQFVIGKLRKSNANAASGRLLLLLPDP